MERRPGGDRNPPGTAQEGGGGMVKIRFERGQEDKVSEEYGPFPFVQLTYDSLRVGPDGDEFAAYDPEGYWFREGFRDMEKWSDVIIY